jgi:hypothetical protein
VPQRSTVMRRVCARRWCAAAACCGCENTRRGARRRLAGPSADDIC